MYTFAKLIPTCTLLILCNAIAFIYKEQFGRLKGEKEIKRIGD